MTPFIAIAAITLIGGSPHAEEPMDPGVFASFLSESSPACVPVEKINKLPSVAHIELSNNQFQFVRAIYVAMPPVSKELPPGDKAMLFGDANSNAVMVALIDDGNACSRLLVPVFIQKMIQEVGEGKTPPHKAKDL